MPLAVIIPTLNEEPHIEQSIASARAGGDDVEIIVSDGHSTDRTVEIARNCGVTVIESQPGRAVQMNTAAAQAKADTLLFLHADTRLPADYPRHVTNTLARPATVAGAFKLRFDSMRPSLRLIELGANLRSRWMELPFGDQAIFLPAATFHEIWGFPDMPILEDYEFVLRLRRRGHVRLAHRAVRTSARRYRACGPFRLAFVHQAMLAGYSLGVSPHRLARWLSDTQSR